MNNFSIELNELTDILSLQIDLPHKIEKLNNHGGVNGLCQKLKTNVHTGISFKNINDLKTRAKQFGINALEPKLARSFFEFVLIALQDKLLIVLIICAFISISFSYIQFESSSSEINPKSHILNTIVPSGYRKIDKGCNNFK